MICASRTENFSVFIRQFREFPSPGDGGIAKAVWYRRTERRRGKKINSYLKSMS
jgi:hypothetical protein